MDPNLSYLKLIDGLCGKAKLVAVASHDEKLVKESLNRLTTNNTPCEPEILFGLPSGVVKTANQMNVPVRIYIPYGVAYLPCALSEIKRKPYLLTWIVKNFFRYTDYRK